MSDEEARRITGRHPLLPGTGAAVELDDRAGVSAADRARGVAARARAIAEGLSLPVGEPVVRVGAHHATVALTCPTDLPFAAAVLLDVAVEAPVHDCDPWAQVAQAFVDEARPALRALVDAAGDRPCFHDDDGFTFGLGVHARTWPLDALPAADALATGGGRIPFAFVTGTNGKTTTTRLLARMAQEAGLIGGHTSSDGVVVDGVVVEPGDWTGPGAARLLLRRPELQLAILETARGGLLRRGLAVEGADAAVLTNITPDHLGEWGLDTVDDLAWAKSVVVEGVRHGGVVVANLGSPPLAAAVQARLRPDLRLWGFAEHFQDGLAGWLDGDALVVAVGGPPRVLLRAADIPISFGGSARYNLENALGAALGGLALGLPESAVVAALRGFRPNVADSRGRANRFRLPDGRQALVDFAHNPDGVARLGDIVSGLAPTALHVVLGAAGDRDDEALTELGEVVAGLGAAQVWLKELPDHLRGRRLGEVPAVLRDALVHAGFPADAIVDQPDEVAACAEAVAALPLGGLALLLVHERVDEVFERLAALGAVEA